LVRRHIEALLEVPPRLRRHELVFRGNSVGQGKALTHGRKEYCHKAAKDVTK
jgi:hypothetical protein